MATEISRTKGTPQAYKLDRGGASAESGPFVGEVRNNTDPTRSGRLQVFIEEFANIAGAGLGDNPHRNNSSNWRTVSYLSPFYGITEHVGSPASNGKFVGNRHSYGMWMTPPDIGTRVLCFFASGDPNQGYYVGCIPEPGITHMVPAVAASSKYIPDNQTQLATFGQVEKLPVTEINDENKQVNENPKFFDQHRPVHSVVAAIMFQQGILSDPVRGVIGSSSMRESPSAVYGISTPGRPIYSGGLTEDTIRAKLDKGEVKKSDIIVEGRTGGHSFVMDDGDVEGNDQLVRIRTSKGHQIMLNDAGDTLHIIHGNGQTWIELGKEGTVDMYSTNSINLRSQGTVNIHADEDINLHAGKKISMYAAESAGIQSPTIAITAEKSLIMHSDKLIGLKSDGSLMIKSNTGVIDGGSTLYLKGGKLGLNSGGSASVATPAKFKQNKLSDTKFVTGSGFVDQPGKLESIVTRAPTHEPYAAHGFGVNVAASLISTAPAVPAAVVGPVQVNWTGNPQVDQETVGQLASGTQFVGPDGIVRIKS
jgi:hypothetical protein